MLSRFLKAQETVLANRLGTHILSRKNLRDLVIVLSLASTFLPSPGTITIFVAVAVLAIGCFLHIVSKGVLIRDIVLCNTGIYQVVRHPYYLANYLVDTSFCLLSGNAFLIFLYPFLFFWAYGPTIRREEQLLLAGHGDSFLRGSMEIPQVFPDPVSAENAKVLFRGFSFGRVTMKECARIMKFFGTGTLFVLIHQVKSDGLNGFMGIFLPSGPTPKEFLFGVITAALYAGSLIVLWVGKQNRNGYRAGLKL
jgi:protein-S-isoprenylcysteine O-methyltransferase Ste14